MRSKRERIEAWRLYVIADRAAAAGRPLEDWVAHAIEGGADVVQYRDKTASDEDFLAQALRLHAVTRRYGIPLIVNDRLALAHSCGAEGVHLGQDDASYAQARLRLGEAAILGRSTHAPEQGLAAEKEGFDYLGVGPVFATPTKPDYRPAGLEYVSFAAQHLRTPFTAIGGIDEQNVRQVKEAGARCVAVVRAVIASDDPRLAASRLKGVMTR